MSDKVFAIKNKCFGPNAVALVKSSTRARAMRHVSKQFEAEVASPEELMAAGAAGQSIVDATQESEGDEGAAGGEGGAQA